MGIEKALASWDGKSAAHLKAVFDAHHTDDSFSHTVIALSFTEACEKGGTWLLKAWLEAGNELEHTQIARVYASLDRLTHWEAKLHVLQSMPFMAIADADRDNVYKFLMCALSEPNKFVRAWAYNGLYELSRQHAGYRCEATQYFEMALRDEAPSVKARIRNLMKNGW